MSGTAAMPPFTEQYINRKRMKAYRLGNDIYFRWTIRGLDEVSGTKVISLYHTRKSTPDTISYEIDDNVVTGVFRGKDQHDQGVYRLLLQVNNGENGMVTLDKVDVFALHGVCAFGIVSGSDDPGVETLTVEIESDIHSPTFYQKPGTGIPKSDLDAEVQASLGLADTALQHVKTINGVSMEGQGNIQINAEVIGGETKIWTVEEALTGDVELEPYKYYVCGEREQLTITVGDAVTDGKLNEYMFEFDSPTDSPTILDVPQTIYSPVSLGIEKGKKYIVHIVGRYMTVSGGTEGYDYTADMENQILSRTATFLKIPIGVAVIEQYQFANFTRLQEVIIPSSILTIGNYAFQNCSALLSIIIPENVTTIGQYAFAGCSSLLSAVIQGAITTLNANTFQNCANLKNIIIPDSVRTIGASVFNGCYELEHIELPPVLNSIGQDAFYNCRKLKSISLPSTFTTLNRAFYNCYELEEIVIPESVITLTGTVFQNCTKLSRVVIEGNVTTIQASCFQNTALTDFPETQGTITTVQGTAFGNCQYLVDFHFPEGVTVANGSCFDGCPQLRTVTLPTTMQNFGAVYVFRNCPQMRLLTVHDTITTLNVHGSPSTMSLKILGTNRVIPVPTSLNAASKVYVDDTMVAAYKASSAWSATQGRIYPMSEYPTE